MHGSPEPVMIKTRKGREGPETGRSAGADTILFEHSCSACSLLKATTPLEPVFYLAVFVVVVFCTGNLILMLIDPS